MIDAHRIAPKLWIGSYPTDPRVCEQFDLIVLCAMELQSLRFPCRSAILHVPLDDAEPTRHEVSVALRAAKEVAEARRQGKRVLVTCAQGVNRSSLVAAMSLAKSGMPPKIAIELIREQRKPPSGMRPLCNPHFVRLLMRMVG